MKHKDISNIIKQVCNIAKSAGDAIMEVYGTEDFGVISKEDDSPLTKADQAANDIIVAALEQLTPEVPIISEELKNAEYEQRKDYEYYWLVDPLDGTKEFIKRNGEFTVNIALIHNNKSIAGVVYVPVTDIMYWAVEGQGAYRESSNDKTKLSCKSVKLTDSKLRVVCSRSHMNATTQALVDTLDAPVLVPRGSSLKFIIIAEGAADYYPRLAPVMEWDTGAAQIILEEAGGSLIDQNTMKPMRYNKVSLLNANFIAYANIQN